MVNRAGDHVASDGVQRFLWARAGCHRATQGNRVFCPACEPVCSWPDEFDQETGVFLVRISAPCMKPARGVKARSFCSAYSGSLYFIEQGQLSEAVGIEIPAPAPTMTLCCCGNEVCLLYCVSSKNRNWEKQSLPLSGGVCAASGGLTPDLRRPLRLRNLGN